MRRNRVLAFAILAVLALAAVAPAGQASAGQQARAERAQQRAIRAAQRAAERESLRLQRLAARAEHDRQARQTQKHEAQKSVTVATEKALVTLSCNQISVEYHGFPEGPASNAITERAVFKQSSAPLPSYASPATSFAFKGTSGVTSIPIVAPLGTSNVALHTNYAMNGVKGRINAHAHLYCGAIPQFTLATQQSLGGSPTTSMLGGKVGQSVVYETLAENTGNTPLTFTNFSDPGCDHLPASAPATVLPHASATYLCMHVLDNADRAAGLYANAASLTGTPEPAQGKAVTLASPGVLISPIEAGEEQHQPTVAGKPEVTTSAAPAKGAVLSFSNSAVPALLGPGKCVRGPFTTSVKSAGVANVTFYLDGRKLSRRTAHSTRGGLISIRVTTKLKAGSKHRLKASITMLPASPAVAAVSAWRGRIVRSCATKPAGSH